MNKREKEEYRQHVIHIYDILVNIQEQRGISYGEIAYVDSLKIKELKELENEIIEELERIEELIKEVL